MTKDTRSYQLRFSVKDEKEEIGWGFLVIVYNDRHEEPYGIMENVYVLPDHRKKGAGKALVSQIIAKAKELRCYKLLGQSRYGRDAVHHFYIRQGFTDHGKNFRMDLLESKTQQPD